MAEQESKQSWGIDAKVIASDIEIESLDSENLQALVKEFNSNQRKKLKLAAEIVCNPKSESVEEMLDLEFRENSQRYTQEDIQEMINLTSLRFETLERIYIAIKEVEQAEQGK